MSPCRLLIIEDEPEIAGIIAHVAEDLGYAVTCVHTVAEIIPTYHQCQPDVIVLDLVMPEMDGFEVLQFLHEEGSASKVVIVSGQHNYRPMATRMAEGFDLRVSATVAKPFRISEMRKVLQQVHDTVGLAQRSA